jgi:hypothetical protein
MPETQGNIKFYNGFWVPNSPGIPLIPLESGLTSEKK